MKRSLVLAVVLAGCSAGAADVGDDGGSNGSPALCAVSMEVSQPLPTAGPTSIVHVRATVTGAPGVLAYAWQVQFNAAPVAFSATTSTEPIDSIQFPVVAAGIYFVTLDVTGSPVPCPSSVVPINIAAPGALTEILRLRVAPPRSLAAPVMEKLIEVKGGADADLGIVGVDSGVLASPVVLGPGGGIPAYLQFSPGGAPDAIVEGFADASGVAAVQLVPGLYSVLVVPSQGDIAPRRISGWSPGAVLQLDAGVPVTGTVLGPSGAALAGATVRVVSDGVPSTMAITAPDGSFDLHAAPGVTVGIEVTPPAASGLPRLLASTPALLQGTPLQILYAANTAPVDLGGTTVRRAEAALAGARLSAVGSLPAVGMVTVGASSVTASGEVRLTATADAAGVLPAMLVPPAQLSAVIEAAPGDLAVVALDTTAGAPASLDAPAMRLITTAVLDGSGAGLPGAVLDLVPSGALAMAMAPALRLTAQSGGVISSRLPDGGHYALRFQDPLGRGAPLTVSERLITAIATSYQLPPALRLQGSLRLDGTMTLSGASVQILCASCTGIDRALPLIEAVSDAAGRFTLAVPDPGTR